ncbi:MAG TPA: hypothetical protein PKA41_10190, partial [Verrucomicrobiota bacterium]|nr:hypothetical protein [Verrucomicrobiota bacterium]
PQLNQMAFGTVTRSSLPKFSYADGGAVTGGAAANNFNFALVDNRQARRQWDARQGMKVLLGDIARRGNSVAL